MNETTRRLTETETPPTPELLQRWLGDEAYNYWTSISELIERKYPGIFEPEWLFGGPKHGWSLRYKKNKSFCTLIPEKDSFKIQIVFGAKERSTVEVVRHLLSSRIQKAYDEAKTYHDGKWLFLELDDDEILADVERLLEVKRKPKK